MILEEISIGEDTESKRNIILDNIGKEVFLYDLHGNWIHGSLLKDGSDNHIYRIALAHTLGEMVKVLNYHDLLRLILLKPHKDYPLPKIE